MNRERKITELTEADIKEIAKLLMEDVNKSSSYGGAFLDITIEMDKETGKPANITMRYNRYPYES